MVNILWDYKQGQTDLSIIVPYDAPAPWKYCGGDNDNQASLGKLYLFVVNTLSSSSASTPSVTIQCFVSAADDFQWALPVDLTGPMYQPPSQDREQDSSPTSSFDVVEEHPLMHAQMDSKPVFATPPCNYPSMSAKCLRDTPHRIMGVGKLFKTTGTCVSSEVRTFRELTNMVSMHYYELATQAPKTTVKYQVNPGAKVAVATIQANFIHNYYEIVRSMFAFWRGGTRVVMTGEAATTGYAQLSFEAPDYTSRSLVEAYPAVVGVAPASYLNTKSIQQAFVSAGVNPIDFTIPYYGTARCMVSLIGGAVSYKEINDVACVGKFYVTGHNSTMDASLSNMIVAIGGADDFICGFQLPSPAMG